MQKISAAQRAILISSFIGGVANPRVPAKMAFETPVRLDPMWGNIDASTIEQPRFKSGMGKEKRAKPFINHQSRYRKLKRLAK